MAVNRTGINQAVGLQDDLLRMAPLPIIARRNPTTSDKAEIGTVWANVSTSTIFMLASITSNSANWTTSPASGVGLFTSVTVNPGDITITAGNLIMPAGNITLTAGNVAIGGDLTVSGTTTLAGDIDFTSAQLIDITSTLNAAPSILLRANGGPLESIELHSDQGTGNHSIWIHSDVGRITIESSQNAANAIVINSLAGGMFLTATGSAGEDLNLIADGSSVNISSNENVADSIVIESANGGIQILASGAAAGEDIIIDAVGSSVVITATEAAADAIVLDATNGGINIASVLDTTVTATGASISMTASEAAVDAVLINASHAAGGVVIRAGSSGVSIGDEADTATITIGSVATTANRDIFIGSGQMVTDNIVDTLYLGDGGIHADGDEQIARIINIGSGQTFAENNALATADLTVNIGSGFVDSDGLGIATVTVNIATGAQSSPPQTRQIVNVGTVDATIDLLGAVDINNNTNANVSINDGTSTGTMSFGNLNAGAITMETGSTIDIDAVGNIAINSSTGTISVGNDDVDFDINIGTTGERDIIVGNTVGATTISLLTPANQGVTLQNSVRLITGAGSPNTVVTAPAGSLFLRTDPAGAASRIYINTDGVTAWTNLTAAA